MKKSKLFMSLISAMMVFAALAFTSCVDDNDDKGMPYLEVTPTALSFDADGKAAAGSEIAINTNRPWRITFEKDVTWVRLSATEGKGSAKISVSVPASLEGRQTTLTIATYNSYGDLLTEKVTVKQGAVVAEELVYKETFGTGGAEKPYPTVADYTGWDKSGSGSSTVTYSGLDAELRTSSPSNNNFSGYPGSGGSNLYFAKAPNNFIVKDITLPTGVTSYTLTFGAYIYNPANVDPYYTTYTAELSADGVKWVKIPFEVNFVAEKSWNLATAKFQLKEYTSKLYIKFSAATSNNRIDDVTLNTGGTGGTLVDLVNGSAAISVVTNTPTGVAATQATLSGTVSTTTDVTAVGFQYTANAPDIDWTTVAKTPVTPVAAAFTKDVTGLTTGTTYAVRAYATMASGDTYGSVVTFVAKEPTVMSIADVIAGGGGKDVLVEGQIVGVTMQSFVLKDDTGLLYVFMGVDPAKQIGDKVKVSGTTQSFGNIIQVSKENVVVTPVSTGSYTQPNPEAFNGAAIDSYVKGTAPLPVKYVQYSGTLSVSGNFYNVLVDGATAKASILYAPTSMVDATWDGKKVVVSGYVVGTPNTNTGFMNTVAVKITEDTSGGPDITSVTPASLTWAATETDAKTITVNGTNLSGVTLTATSDAATSAFTFAVNGTTVTVTPKAANTGAANISETLTIAAPGGNSKTVALMQSKPSDGGFTGLLAKWVFASATALNATEGNTASVISRVGVTTAITYTGSSTSIWCNGWDGADATPKYWLLTIPHTSAFTAGSTLKVDWGAWGTATSPKNWDVEYSTDNTSWTKIASEVYTDVNKATHSLTSDAFASQIAAGTLYVRFKVNGTVPIGADKTVVESGGNSRMANVSVSVE